MFPRVKKVKRANGQVDEYIQIVESIRDADGKVRQRTVVSLGRKELLAPHVDGLVKILGGQHRVRDASDVDAGEQAPEWGRMLAVAHVWHEFGLTQLLDKLEQRPRSDRPRVADKALALVANRLCDPTSEHGIARWLETTFVCNRIGQRWLPEWRDDEERRHSRRPRVMVKAKQLAEWYRTLDFLVAHKERIEKELYLRLRDLFSLNADMVFYDLTSTYFEGRGPVGLAFHGHSRDGKPRNRQVLVGVVMVDGWPIAHHVFKGKLRDAKTVKCVLSDIARRFGLKRVVFVGDRGMVTSDNVALIKKEKHGYLVGLNRRRNERIHRYIERASGGAWTPCPVGITASEKSTPPRTLVQEVKGDEEGVRVFVVHSEEREEYERTQREKCMEKVRDRLMRLERRVVAGKLKDPSKIGAAAVRALSKNHGTRYYAWKLSKEGRFCFFEHPVNLPREKALEGKFLIQTEEKNLTPVEAVQRYKELMVVESAIRNLKDVLDMRPIHHHAPERVKAHIFVAWLGLLTNCWIRRALRSATRIDWSPEEALGTLRTIQVVDLDIGPGEVKRCVTRGTPRAQRVLKALGIQDRRPPGGDTTMEPQSML